MVVGLNNLLVDPTSPHGLGQVYHPRTPALVLHRLPFENLPTLRIYTLLN